MITPLGKGTWGEFSEREFIIKNLPSPLKRGIRPAGYWSSQLCASYQKRIRATQFHTEFGTTIIETATTTAAASIIVLIRFLLVFISIRLLSLIFDSSGMAYLTVFARYILPVYLPPPQFLLVYIIEMHPFVTPLHPFAIFTNN